MSKEVIWKEMVREKMINIKQELEDLKKMRQGETGGPAGVKRN